MRNTWESHPDYDNLKKALVRIQEVAEFVNEQKRYKENFARILEIYNSLVGIKVRTKTAIRSKFIFKSALYRVLRLKL